MLDAHRQWSDTATVRLVAPILAGQAAEARAFAATGTGKRLFDALRARVDELRVTLDRLVAAEAARIEAVRATTSWLLAGAIAAAVTCALLTLVGVRRAVTRPLATLVDAVSALGAGALDRDVPVTGPPEFRTVARSVERMRTGLNDARRPRRWPRPSARRSCARPSGWPRTSRRG